MDLYYIAMKLRSMLFNQFMDAFKIVDFNGFHPVLETYCHQGRWQYKNLQFDGELLPYSYFSWDGLEYFEGRLLMRKLFVWQQILPNQVESHFIEAWPMTTLENLSLTSLYHKPSPFITLSTTEKHTDYKSKSHNYFLSLVPQRPTHWIHVLLFYM